MLPTDHEARKDIPLARGLLDYFPDACAAVAEVSRVSNEQHNPGQPMHWAREKSTDHADCIVRHLVDRGLLDSDGLRHSAKVAWRALALLQLEIEAAQKVEEFVATVADRAPPACPDTDDLWCNPPSWSPPDLSPRQHPDTGGPTAPWPDCFCLTTAAAWACPHKYSCGRRTLPVVKGIDLDQGRE